jgi:hypothetical protein
MAVTAVPYGSITTMMVSGVFDYLGVAQGCALTTNLYTPVRDTHDYLSDISAELTDPSYDRVMLTGKTTSFNATTHTLTLGASDLSFPNLISTNIRYAVFYQVGATDALSPLIGYWDLGANYNANVNDFQLILSANGLMTIDL